MPAFLAEANRSNGLTYKEKFEITQDEADLRASLECLRTAQSLCDGGSKQWVDCTYAYAHASWDFWYVLRNPAIGQQAASLFRDVIKVEKGNVRAKGFLAAVL